MKHIRWVSLAPPRTPLKLSLALYSVSHVFHLTLRAKFSVISLILRLISRSNLRSNLKSIFIELSPRVITPIGMPSTTFLRIGLSRAGVHSSQCSGVSLHISRCLCRSLHSLQFPSRSLHSFRRLGRSLHSFKRPHRSLHSFWSPCRCLHSFVRLTVKDRVKNSNIYHLPKKKKKTPPGSLDNNFLHKLCKFEKIGQLPQEALLKNGLPAKTT